jgi:hypothetical protein
MVAYSAGDASKRASCGCSSLHSAHTGRESPHLVRFWSSSRLSIFELHPHQSTTRTNPGPNYRHAKEIQEAASTSPPKMILSWSVDEKMQWIFHLQTGASDHQEKGGCWTHLTRSECVYPFRINIMVVSSNHQHTKTYNPPPNTSSLDESWLIFLSFWRLPTLPLHPPTRFHHDICE